MKMNQNSKTIIATKACCVLFLAVFFLSNIFGCAHVKTAGDVFVDGIVNLKDDLIEKLVAASIKIKNWVSGFKRDEDKEQEPAPRPPEPVTETADNGNKPPGPGGKPSESGPKPSDNGVKPPNPDTEPSDNKKPPIVEKLSITIISLEVIPNIAKRGDTITIRTKYVVSGADSKGIHVREKIYIIFEKEAIKADDKTIRRKNGTYSYRILAPLSKQAPCGTYKVIQKLLVKNKQKATMHVPFAVKSCD